MSASIICEFRFSVTRENWATSQNRISWTVHPRRILDWDGEINEEMLYEERWTFHIKSSLKYKLHFSKVSAEKCKGWLSALLFMILTPSHNTDGFIPAMNRIAFTSEETLNNRERARNIIAWLLLPRISHPLIGRDHSLHQSSWKPRT